MAIMIKYQSDTPNFDEEPDKVLKHIETFKQPGEWKNQDLGTGAGNNSVEVTVKGPNTSAMKDTVNRVEKMMTDIKRQRMLNLIYHRRMTNMNKKLTKIKLQIMVFLHNPAMNLNENLPEKQFLQLMKRGCKGQTK